MEISKLFNLPAHPLLVHIPVVLVPLAALAAVLIALRPSWRHHYGWLAVAFSGVAMVFSFLASGSGEALEDSVKKTKSLSNHTELGGSMKWIALAFFVVVLALVVLDRTVSNGPRVSPIIHRFSQD